MCTYIYVRKGWWSRKSIWQRGWVLIVEVRKADCVAQPDGNLVERRPPSFFDHLPRHRIVYTLKWSWSLSMSIVQFLMLHITWSNNFCSDLSNLLKMIILILGCWRHHYAVMMVVQLVHFRCYFPERKYLKVILSWFSSKSSLPRRTIPLILLKL